MVFRVYEPSHCTLVLNYDVAMKTLPASSIRLLKSSYGEPLMPASQTQHAPSPPGLFAISSHTPSPIPQILPTRTCTTIIIHTYLHLFTPASNKTANKARELLPKQTPPHQAPQAHFLCSNAFSVASSVPSMAFQVLRSLVRLVQLATAWQSTNLDLLY